MSEKAPKSKSICATYTASGVDRDAATRAKKKVAQLARSTLRPEVLSGVGFFGGLFEFKGYKKPVLVSSVDGVGTKLKIAIALDKHDTVGIDIVNHCINDILCCGAEPLFFLDYISMGKLTEERVTAIVKGLAKACREANCALIGGETAEMPGLYTPNDYDLAGFIIGVVEKPRIIMGKDIAVGDAIIGLPSSGLHTNGYSLVRKLFGEDKKSLNKYYSELGRTLGEELLEPHRSYLHEIKPHLPIVKGISHITGGGLLEKNVTRVVQEGMAARFFKRSWEVLPIFDLIQKKGKVTDREMHRVFNMGLGIAVFCSPEKVKRIMKALPEARIVGEVVKKRGKAAVLID